jgi:hypothetical protein
MRLFPILSGALAITAAVSATPAPAAASTAGGSGDLLLVHAGGGGGGFHGGGFRGGGFHGGFHERFHSAYGFHHSYGYGGGIAVLPPYYGGCPYPYAYNAYGDPYCPYP